MERAIGLAIMDTHEMEIAVYSHKVILGIRVSGIAVVRLVEVVHKLES
jgi:hypothetical protein